MSDVPLTSPEESSAHPPISPPLSPTTQIAAGSPVSSPTELDDFVPPLVGALGPRGSSPAPSPSPPPAPSPARSPSREHADMSPGADSVAAEWQRPVASRSKSTSVSAAVSDLPLKDLSRYTEPTLPAAARSSSSTTLAELAHLLRLQRDQDRKYRRVRERVYRCLLSTVLSARLARCADVAQSTLVEYLKLEDKRGFASLHDALHDVRLSCDATRRYAFMEPGLDIRTPDGAAAERLPIFPTFLHQIPRTMREDFLHLISEVRTKPDFLAGRIAALSRAELLSFSTPYQPLETDAVLSGHARGTAQGSGMRRGVDHSKSPVERLLSFQRHDPLSVLLYTVFANSGGPHAAEDLRRTDVWSSTCARLIAEGTQGGEQFMHVVLNSWARLRDWPAKGNLELFLMRILQDGAFLLDRADHQVLGPRPTSDPTSTKESLAAEEFFDVALKRLFETIDGSIGVEGFPLGVLELGTAILRKLESAKKQRAARTFIVSKWFFSGYLMNAIVFPETYGMMANHHITIHARRKILEEIATRAKRLVWEVAIDWKSATAIRPDIRSHIESILARFEKVQTLPPKPSLNPARTITSPRETSEVLPFLVLCPSDIITLVNTLFPDRRPSSSFSEANRSQPGLWSSASSISEVSSASPAGPPSRSGNDPASLLSNSGSSITSGSISQDPVLDPLGQHADGRSSYTSIGSHETLLDLHHPDSVESLGQALRSHVLQLPSYVGFNAANGTSHPCAERWAVVFVSEDGDRLGMTMPQDLDDEEDDDDDYPEASPDGQEAPAEADLGRNYDQLKQSVSQLLQDYEIPKDLLPESESKSLSNRLSVLRGISGRIGTINASRTSSLGRTMSKNPYHRYLSQVNPPERAHSPPANPESNARPDREDQEGTRSLPGPPAETSLLLTMLEGAIRDRQAKFSFVTAHSYWVALQQLRQLSSSSLAREDYAPLLNYFARGPRESVSKLASAIEEYEAWLVWLQQSQERHGAVIEDMMKRLHGLRNKMWYVTDVQNSAAYEEARNVAIALRSMGQPSRATKTKSSLLSRPRHSARATASSLLLKSEAQMLELMAAPPEQGGMGKLSDTQSEMTHKWLVQSGIENYCKGEERIHRFCLEVDRCVNKLIGHDITDAPVLWSSELYHRDKLILTSGQQKGDLYLTEFGTLRPIGPDVSGRDERRRTPLEYDYVSRPVSRDHRPLWMENHYQQTFNVSPWNTRGSRTPLDSVHSSARYAAGNQAFSFEASETFWSPFLNQAPSRTSLLRQASQRSLSRQDSMSFRQAERSLPFKQRFLLELRQTLTELLLSDLGITVWSQGSETDRWFSGELGERFLRPPESERLDQGHNETGLRRRATISDSSTVDQSGQLPHNLQLDSGTGSSASALARDPAEPPARAEHGASTPGKNITDNGTSSFPYETSFRALLGLFSAHPSPFVKLQALSKLELMILASLHTSSRPLSQLHGPTAAEGKASAEGTRLSDPGYSHRNTPTLTAKQWDQIVATGEGAQTRAVPSRHPSRSPPKGMGEHSSVGLSNTDRIIATLQRLFRDAGIRPRYLFRDLQFIAAFVPRPILEKTETGKAFRHASVAAVSLKQDICRMMIELADNIVAYHTKTRTAPLGRGAAGVGSGSGNSGPRVDEVASSSSSSSSPSSSSAELSRYSMADAAAMYSISAKEGYPVAQRELAIFYLTHPDLVARTTLPLSRPSDTFKAQLMNQRDGDAARSDPASLCVAYHWMELSSQGGDELARQNMRTRAELNALP